MSRSGKVNHDGCYMTKTSSLASTNYDSTHSIFENQQQSHANGPNQAKLVTTTAISSTHSSPIVRSVSSMASASTATTRKPRVLAMSKTANNKSMASSSDMSFRTAPTSPIVSTPRSADDFDDDCFDKNGFR